MAFYPDDAAFYPGHALISLRGWRHRATPLAFDRVMACIPEKIAANPSMTDAEKNRLSRLYDALRIRREASREQTKKRPTT